MSIDYLVGVLVEHLNQGTLFMVLPPLFHQHSGRSIPSSSARNSDVYLYIAIPICHSYVVNEWLNRHCDGQIDITIRADELGISPFQQGVFIIR
jgi:hypothetical protein